MPVNLFLNKESRFMDVKLDRSSIDSSLFDDKLRIVRFVRLLNFILFNGFLQIVSYFKLVKLDKSIDMRLLFDKLR